MRKERNCRYGNEKNTAPQAGFHLTGERTDREGGTLCRRKQHKNDCPCNQDIKPHQVFSEAMKMYRSIRSIKSLPTGKYPVKKLVGQGGAEVHRGHG